MVYFWSDLNLFNPNQYAYLRAKSTLAQLLTCYNDWAKARNRSQQTDIIFLDLSEAFDSVPHERFIVAETTTAWDRWLSITVACLVKGQLFRLVPRDFRRVPRNNTQPNLIYHLCK